MGLLDGLSSLLSGGGGGSLQDVAGGRGNYADSGWPDNQNFQKMVGQAPPGLLQKIFGGVAGQMDPQEYANHVTPGVGGTNPLGAIGGGGLGLIASTLINKLSGGGIAGGLLSKIPGLHTTDPQQMDADQVAALSRYTQQNHPELFGQAAADVGQQRPDLLHSFLGKAGLAVGAAALASHFLKTDSH